MTATNHVLAGTVIALVIKQPLLVAPLAFLSHFLLDMFPHFGGAAFYSYGHKHFMKVIAADGLLCIATLLGASMLNPALTVAIFVAGFFAVLPDLFWLDHFKNKREHWFYTFHQWIQWYEKPLGALTEITFCLLAFLVAFK